MLIRTPGRTRRPRTVLLPLGLATLVAGAAAQPAAAAYEHYGVEVDATVRTSYVGSQHTPTFEHDSSLSMSTHVTAGFLAQIERDAGGRIIGASGQDQHEATTTGTITTREREFAPAANDWYERGSSCTGAGKNENDEGRTILESDPITPLVGGALRLTLADQLLVAATCEATGRHGGAGPGSVLLTSPPPEDPFGAPGPLAVDVALPPEATAAGKVIQLFRGPAEGHAAYCPEDLAERAPRQSCRVTFEGTITLTKVDLGGGGTGAPGGGTDAGGGAGTPGAAGPGAGGTGRPAGTPASSAPRIAPGQRATLGAGGSRLTFRATCPTACRGTATVRVPVRGRRGAKARTRVLATVPVRLSGGPGARTVRLAIPKGVRRTLSRATGATVLVALRPTGGRRTTVVLRIGRRS